MAEPLAGRRDGARVKPLRGAPSQTSTAVVIELFDLWQKILPQISRKLKWPGRVLGFVGAGDTFMQDIDDLNRAPGELKPFADKVCE
jgi:hypothetical protein